MPHQKDGPRPELRELVFPALALTGACLAAASLLAVARRPGKIGNQGLSLPMAQLPDALASAQQRLQWAQRGMRAHQLVQPLASAPAAVRWMRRGVRAHQLSTPVTQVPDRAKWFQRGRRSARVGIRLARVGTGQRWYRRGLTHGIIVGIVLGILVAPRPGDETRVWLERTLRDGWERGSALLRRLSGSVDVAPTTEAPGSQEQAVPGAPANRDGRSAHARV